MTYSLDQIKGEISRGGGLTKSNLYRIILPIVPEIFVNLTGIDIPYPQSLNVLCKNMTMPGRQITTVDKTIGVVTQKVAYGYANDDVNLTFIGLNNYGVRKYFEQWQFYAMNEDTHEVRYKDQYAKTVTLQQLDLQHRVVYSVNLENAFPTQLLEVGFQNDNGAPVDINVTLSYTRWRRNNVVRDVISTEAQDFLEGLLLKG